MIKEITMYTMICDRCGKDICDDTEHSSWNTKQYLTQIADEMDWIQYINESYVKEDICNDCYCYNDKDELEINDKRIKIYLRNE